MMTGRSPVIVRPPDSTGPARCRPARRAATSTSATVPSAGAWIWCSIFIASTTTSGWPAAHGVAGGDQHPQHRTGHRGDQRAGRAGGVGLGVAGQHRERRRARRRRRRSGARRRAPPSRRVPDAVDLELDAVGLGGQDRPRPARSPSTATSGVASEPVRDDARPARRGASVDAPGRRPGCCASPTGCRARTPAARSVWRPGRRARRPRRRAAVAGDRLGARVLVEEAGVQVAGTERRVAQDAQQLIAVRRRPVQPGRRQSCRAACGWRRRGSGRGR